MSLSVTIGPWSIDTGDDPVTELIEVETHARLGSTEPVCRVVAYSPPPGSGDPGAAVAGAVQSGASGLDASGSFGTSIRGQPIATGDPISIELTAGDVTETVATAEVDEVRSSVGLVSVLGRGALQRLAAGRESGVFENQTAGQIVQDLAGRVGVTTGELGSGATYPHLVVHESRSLLRHVMDLAGRESMDLYQTPEGELTMKRFEKTSADHVLRHAAEVLDVELTEATPGERVVAYAESPSSTQGGDTWHWLVKDGSSFRGEAGDGHLALALQDGAIRSKEAADQLAASRWGRMSDDGRIGRVRALGNPAIKLGDAIEIAESPRSQLDGTFKVTSVRHRFGRSTGFLTEIGFSDLGGSTSAAVAGGLGA